MFSVVSRSGLGGFMLLAEQIAKLVFGEDAIPDGTFEKVADAVYTIVAFGLLMWSLLTNPDLKYGLFRK